ncbi:TetR/AcrR family transcriptional regulator [Roseibium sp.]|uniref:TetR/AcrR family transcriptional regulator n=1 Tax=Roseibium sp. TaxID=1936156 RepID=UPI003D108B80
MTQSDPAAGTIVRRMPVQKRSRERFELILDAAVALISEKGVDQLKMNDIVERTGVKHGSLYQYFPEKRAVIATLLDVYNRQGHDCVRLALEPVKTEADLLRALTRILDEYFEMFSTHPVMGDLIGATRADPELQKLEEADIRILSGILADAMRRAGVAGRNGSAETTAMMLMDLIAAVVCRAVCQPQEEAEQTVSQFKQLLAGGLANL